MVRIDAEEGTPLTVIVNFATHPVSMTGAVRLISAGFPGTVRRLVRQLTGAECLFLQGASGNINPIRMEATGEPVRSLGTRLGSEVVRVWESIVPGTVERLGTGRLRDRNATRRTGAIPAGAGGERAADARLCAVRGSVVAVQHPARGGKTGQRLVRAAGAAGALIDGSIRGRGFRPQKSLPGAAYPRICASNSSRVIPNSTSS